MSTATETKPQSSTLSSKGMLIGGQWVESASGARLTVENPAKRAPIAEVPRKAGQRQRQGNPIERAGRGHAMRDFQAFQHRTYAFDRAKRGAEGLTHLHLQFAGELLRNGMSHALVMLQNRVQAPAEKQVKGFVQADLDSTPHQDFGKATTAQ